MECPERDCYLILCHNRPWQVNALSAYLAEQGHEVFIHVDASSPVQEQINTSARVHLVQNRVAVSWGSFSMIEAEMACIRAAAESGKEFRYVHLLSGQCLPAMNRRDSEQFLQESAQKRLQFLSCTESPAESGWGRDGILYRFAVWYPQFMVNRRSPWHRLFWKWVRLWKILGLRRNWKPFAPFHFGSQWWTLTYDCVKQILSYVDTHPEYYDFFRHTFCSDEMFVQSCVMHLPGKDWQLVRAHKRFMIWHRGPSPQDITREKWGEVRGSGCLFARKFSHEPGETEEYFRELNAD